MSLKIIKFNDQEKWDNIVKSFKQWDVYYLNGYVKGFKLIGDGEPLLFYYEEDNFKLCYVTMKRDISKLQVFNKVIVNKKYYDFCTPYGYGGPLIEGEISENNMIQFMKLYQQYCLSEGVISEFIRYSPILNNSKYTSGFYENINIRDTVAIDLNGNEEELWQNITSKNRNMIRKALKNNIVIKHGISVEIKKQFMDIYIDTMKRDDAEEYYYFNTEFFESIFDDLKENVTIFYAELNGNIIAASIVLYNDKYAHYHFSGIRREYMNLAANNLLLYGVASWANTNGIIKFHLGGGYSSRNDSLFKFKKSFTKKEPLEFFIGKRVLDNKKYETLIKHREIYDSNFNKNNEFFPKYRG